MKILLLQICFLLPFLLGAADLRDLLNVPAETFWERDAAALQKSAGVPFASGTKDRKSIRYPVKKKQTTGKLLWLDQPVCEVVCSLTSPGGKLQAMEISIYNRGDAGRMPDRDFKRLREQTELEIGKLSGSSTPPARDRTGAGSPGCSPGNPSHRRRDTGPRPAAGPASAFPPRPGPCSLCRPARHSPAER